MQQMAIMIIGMRSAPTVSKSQMAMIPPNGPKNEIPISVEHDENSSYDVDIEGTFLLQPH